MKVSVVGGHLNRRGLRWMRDSTEDWRGFEASERSGRARWVFTAGRSAVFQLAGTILLWSVVMERQQSRQLSADLHNKSELHMKLWTSLVVFSFLSFFCKSIVVSPDFSFLSKNSYARLPLRAGMVLKNFGEWGKTDVEGTLQQFRRNCSTSKGGLQKRNYISQHARKAEIWTQLKCPMFSPCTRPYTQV